MKKTLISIVLIMGLLYLLLPRTTTPYSGKYLCVGHSNYLLILKPNNKFIMYDTFGKSAVDSKGNYTVKNNHIELNFTDENGGLYKNFMSSGTVYGSDIIFSQSYDSSEVKFEKI